MKSNNEVVLSVGELGMVRDGIHQVYEFVGFSDDDFNHMNQMHFRDRATSERYMAPPIWSDASDSELVRCSVDEAPLESIRLAKGLRP